MNCNGRVHVPNTCSGGGEDEEGQWEHARSSITLRWKPYFQRGLKDSKLDNHLLKWADSLPRRVMAVKKPDPTLLPAFIELLTHLVSDLHLEVLVEINAVSELRAAAAADEAAVSLDSVISQLRTFVYAEFSFSDRTVDLIVCIGGDGSLLYASNLFQADVPPILAFHHHNSLGLLSPHRFENYRADLRSVLNEVVIDRGPSGYLCIIDVLIEERTVTTVQGDGLIVSSPTGSTAYAMAAGANMLHPSVPALLVAPVCPHSLSFRPVVLPASTSIKVRLAEAARGTAWVSFDGRDRQELLPGDSVSITTSEYMVPSISARSPLQDWFSGLADCFHWNVRSVQNKQKSV
uniref:NAD(+) kinase n=2 Tax=Macrostomum lignano TaxID=282301 RepID=A0A1I8J5R1_9PLAT